MKVNEWDRVAPTGVFSKIIVLSINQIKNTIIKIFTYSQSINTKNIYIQGSKWGLQTSICLKITEVISFLLNILHFSFHYKPNWFGIYYIITVRVICTFKYSDFRCSPFVKSTSTCSNSKFIAFESSRTDLTGGLMPIMYNLGAISNWYWC